MFDKIVWRNAFMLCSILQVWVEYCHFSKKESAVTLLILMKTFDSMSWIKCQRPIPVFHIFSKKIKKKKKNTRVSRNSVGIAVQDFDLLTTFCFHFSVQWLMCQWTSHSLPKVFFLKIKNTPIMIKPVRCLIKLFEGKAFFPRA